MNNQMQGGMGGMGGGNMNPAMMMNPMMGGMGGMDGMMNPMMGMPGMGMGGMGMGMGMPGMGAGMGGGMGMPGMGPGGGGPGMGPGGPMGGDPSQDRFYKSKMCHKWEQTGACPYGPTCKYAHGPNDLRGGGPMGGGGGGANRAAGGSGKVMTPNGPPAGGMGGGMGGMMGGGPMQPRPPAGNAGGGGGDASKSGHWRTRLCEGFMQNGTCRYGDKCTFAHGAHQLRQGGPGGGGMQRNQGSGGNQGQKRGLDQGGAGNESNKRQKGGMVEPPHQERFPDGSMSLEQVEQRFAELKQEVNRFAAETGYSVAVFSVGGSFTPRPDSMEDHMVLATVKAKEYEAEDNLRVAVLKYATGGVAQNLITRGEITKFVSQRGVKAMAEMRAQQQMQPQMQDLDADQEQASA